MAKPAKQITIDGETKTIEEWAEFLDISIGTIRARISRGWKHERAIATPARKMTSEEITIDGVTDTIAGHAKRNDINVYTVYARISRGATAIEALSKKTKTK